MKQSKEKSISYKNRTSDTASTIHYFTQDEIQAILSVLSRSENGQRIKSIRKALQEKMLFLLGLDLGARVSEIASLKWANIDFDRKTIKIWDEKKDTWRICTVSESVWQMLVEFSKDIDKRKEKEVFGMSYKTINRRIKAWAKKAGIEREVRWHMVRHTHVVQSRRAGRDWDWISQQTGDRVSTLIQVYSRLSLEDRQKITDEKPLIEGVN